ncbi:MAG: hypothetical protein OCD02_05315 [Spirochaetaceae bacterium]
MTSFEELISVHCIRLYKLCLFTSELSNKDVVLNRRFLGQLNLEATWMEETLDASGAMLNDKWFPFREGVSAIKLFSTVTYDVIHVNESYPHYHLIEISEKFKKDITGVLHDLHLSLVKTSKYLVKNAKKCGIHGDYTVSADEYEDFDIALFLKNDNLPRNRKLRHIKNPGTTLIYLSTEFLSLKSSMSVFNKFSNLKKSEYKSCIPDLFSEEKLRLILARFHNLQSLYDTYLSESDIEDADSRLKVLRGHISIIYHMLESATKFTHYYERHIVPRQSSIFFSALLPLEIDRFLEITIDFFMTNFICFFKDAKELCGDVIDSYAEIGEKTVPIPRYRGFHVRPSSLISKIVNYYGGRVKMFIGDAVYDPSTPLELFRVNEEINAMKRVRLFELVNNQNIEKKDIRSLLDVLSDSGDVIVYDNSFPDIETNNEETIVEYHKKAITFLLASGKIDISMDITVKFVGDMRSLIDIELLAENGYGENKYGANISLPKKLCYLKR